MSSQRNYRHSEVFAAYKATNERIKTNLTSSQYLKTLDQYLLNAAVPIIEGTNYMDIALPKMLAWQQLNFRRKLSMKNIDLPSKVIEFLLRDLPDEKVTVWKDLALDRAAVFSILEAFLSSLSEFEAASNCELTPPNGVDQLAYCLYVAQKHEQSFAARKPLITTILQVKYWLEEAREFKRRILEKYTRLCLMTAQKEYRSYFNYRVSLDDIVQSYIIAASRAIDKCDPGQGALTSHIQNWLLTARNHLSRALAAENHEISLESLDRLDPLLDAVTNLVSDAVVSAERATHIRKIARMADLPGHGRILLGIEEMLPPSSRSYLHSLSTEVRNDQLK